MLMKLYHFTRSIATKQAAEISSDSLLNVNFQKTNCTSSM